MHGYYLLILMGKCIKVLRSSERFHKKPFGNGSLNSFKFLNDKLILCDN